MGDLSHTERTARSGGIWGRVGASDGSPSPTPNFSGGLGRARGGSVLVFAVDPRFCKRIQTRPSIDGSDVSDADGCAPMPLGHLLIRRSG